MRMFWYPLWKPTWAKVIKKTIPVTTEVTRKVPSYEWVLEERCRHCRDGLLAKKCIENTVNQCEVGCLSIRADVHLQPAQDIQPAQASGLIAGAQRRSTDNERYESVMNKKIVIVENPTLVHETSSRSSAI